MASFVMFWAIHNFLAFGHCPKGETFFLSGFQSVCFRLVPVHLLGSLGYLDIIDIHLGMMEQSPNELLWVTEWKVIDCFYLRLCFD